MSMKLIRDSSYSIGKLGSYQDCKYKIYYDSNNESLSSQNISYNYLLVYDTPTDYSTNPILFSLCVPNAPDCEEKDFKSIIPQFMQKTGFNELLSEDINVYIFSLVALPCHTSQESTLDGTGRACKKGF